MSPTTQAGQGSSIHVNDLTYKFPDGSSGLEEVSLGIPDGSRVLLIGANGAGKTTLLRLLSGKRLSPPSTITISSLDPFTHNLAGITYLGLEWVLNPVVRTDIAVPALLSSVGGDAYPERRDELIDLLDIDMSWRMHTVSDGERRRVQLAMGLLRPWKVLLLDEITVDLDLLTRARLLNWLKKESASGCRGPNDDAEGEGRGSTVVYATHVFGAGQAGWPTHLVHMNLGRVKECGEAAEFLPRSKKAKELSNGTKVNGNGDVDDAEDSDDEGGDGGLGHLVLRWLKDDFKTRGPRGERGGQGKTYQSHEGKGGYGQEKTPS